jgi:tRNA(Ile)-lysidine synthase
MPLDVSAAHYDHALRPESAADARWVRGLCAAWDVPLRSEHSVEPPPSEDAGRRQRYAFIERAREDLGADEVLFAHHADDHAETVLFRALRGTGIAGLAGIPPRREGWIYRPLLDMWREELEGYAAAKRLSWREDPSNTDLRFARNAVRHRLIPDAERWVAPGARRALVRLARLADENERAWAAQLGPLVAALARTDDDGALRIDRGELLGLDASLRPRLLRAFATRAGLALDETLTGLAADFAQSGRSGTAIELGGGFALRRELDALVLGRVKPAEPDRPLVIADAGPGVGEALLAGVSVPVAWGDHRAAQRAHCVGLRVGPDRFPLSIRARVDGDRIRTGGGTRKLKKLLLEARIPLDRRGRTPVVVDSSDRVLWVPGVATAEDSEAGPEGGTTLTIGIG